MQLIVISNCSAKKTVEIQPELRASALKKASLPILAKEWCERVVRASSRLRADMLYNGRAFQITKDAVRAADAKLFVLSAGMGLVKYDALIPSYSLSVGAGSDCILDRAPHRTRFSAQQWWQAIHSAADRPTPIKNLLQHRPNALLVIAATHPYLSMMSDELAGLQEHLFDRVRIVGLKASGFLDPQLQPAVMPYDARLNDTRLALRGTEFDYPARALAHFVDLIRRDGEIRPVNDHARRVRLSLAHLAAPERTTRRRIDEKSLHRKIKSFKRDGISKTKALDTLRHTMGLACEQQRFLNAWTNE